METFSALLSSCAGSSSVTGEFPSQRPVTRSLDVFFYLRLNKLFSKQSQGWWFETPSRPLRRHCNDLTTWRQATQGAKSAMVVVLTKFPGNITAPPTALQWRHNEYDGVSNHQPYDCLLNRLFRRSWKNTSMLCVTSLCEGNSSVTGEFPA